MLKKFFAGIFLAAVIFFCGQNNFASAQDVYIGTSNATGWDCYAMTETFERHVGARLNYNATIKMVTPAGKIKYLSYTIGEGGGYPVWYRNEQGYTGAITQYGTPIEWNLYRLLKEHYGDY